MKQLLIGLCVISFIFAGCEEDCSGPKDHTVCKDGASHKEGLNDPQSNCASCHNNPSEESGIPKCSKCH